MITFMVARPALSDIQLGVGRRYRAWEPAGSVIWFILNPANEGNWDYLTEANKIKLIQNLLTHFLTNFDLFFIDKQH